MNTKLEKYLQYAREVRHTADWVIKQADPYTADLEGLKKMAKALEIDDSGDSTLLMDRILVTLDLK